MSAFSKSKACDTDKQKGYALILVLWSLVLLSLLTAMLISKSRFAVKAEANAWKTFEAKQAAESAFTIGALRLFEAPTYSAYSLYGAPRSFIFQDTEGNISIQDELGKIDLNIADERLLRELLSAAGASPSEAQMLAWRIIEWRGGRLQRRPSDLVNREYELEGLPYLPRGRAFQSIGELRLVMGMNEDLINELLPAVTIYSHSGNIDPGSAPEIVLRAAPGVSSIRIQNILNKRGSASDNEVNDSHDTQQARRSLLEGRAFTIGVQFDLDGERYLQSRVVRVTGSPTTPFWIHE